MTSPLSRFALALAVLSLAACGGESGGGTSDGDAAVASFVLEKDYANAVPVYEAKKSGEGDEVTVFGRVRSELEGSGAFTIIDDTVPYCGKGQEKCGCPTPWDYCCEVEKVPGASLAVEVRDAKGDVVDLEKTDVRLLDLVALKGTLTKTESGSLFLVVNDGWYRRERPQLEGKIDWP